MASSPALRATVDPSAFRAVGEDAGQVIELAVRYAPLLPLPGAGRTAERFRLLADVASTDVTGARVLEAHSDALAILAEAGEARPQGSWGVFAAEGPGVRLDAEVSSRGVTLTGIKPWCSLAGRLDHALVTAHTPDGRQLFAVDLHHPSVHPEAASSWVARGLTAVPSVPVRFAGTPARAVGAVGWYLERPGFAWGGVGVAACWFGGAEGFRAALESRARTGDPLAAAHLGAVDVDLQACAALLDAAGAAIDAGAARGAAGALLALRVRSFVAAAVERVLSHVGRALGPAPLAFDEAHARRVADLGLYVRQHHAERDLAELGRQLAG